MKRFFHWSNILVCFLWLAGCGKPPASAVPRSPEKPQAKAPSRVTNRPGNVAGSAIIVEYHKIAKQEARWDRSIVRFRQDLERFFKLGFRPVSLRSFLEGKMDLPSGASPVVFTFDDSHPSQFQLRPDGSLDPDCALGIWETFAKEHPDFPIRATFFVLPNTGPWGQPKLVDAKLKMLKEWGCELGSHTLTHRSLAKLSDAEVEQELSGANAWIEKHGFDPFSIALPYGIRPKNKALLAKYHRAALLVGAGPAPVKGAAQHQPLAIPRIQGIDGDYGITYWLDRVADGRLKPYVEP